MTTLRPELESKARLVVSGALALPVACVLVVTQALRTPAEQMDLYAQGRTKPGRIVTNARGGESAHNFGAAFDFAFLVDGALSWDESLPWAEIGAFGESLGLAWGGRWKTPDRPHFELKDWKKLKVPS